MFWDNVYQKYTHEVNRKNGYILYTGKIVVPQSLHTENWNI